MQRPVMNPSFFEDTPDAPSERRRLLGLLWKATWRTLRLGFRLLTYDPFSRIVAFRVEEGTPASRFLHGLMYRLAFVPVLIAGTACAIVWAGTHPRTVLSETDPAWQGVYYEAITFLGTDQMRLEGWLVPAIDARAVLAEKEKILKKKHPAVVLVHDIGQRREQMIPLIKPLHDAGFVVLAINLRGGGVIPAVGETFGLQESGDVLAAVDTLRRRAFVDPMRIAVVGCGTGATAALLAAQADSQVAAVVAERPTKDVTELVHNRLMPQSSYLAWLSPLCKWTFEMSYGVDAEQIELTHFHNLFASRPVLLVDGSGAHVDPTDSAMVDQVTTFLKASMPDPKQVVANAK